MRKVTLVVSEVCAGALRQFARELGARQPAGPAHLTPQWRALCPSVPLIVEPGHRAPSFIPGTWAPGVALAPLAFAACLPRALGAFRAHPHPFIPTYLPRVV